MVDKIKQLNAARTYVLLFKLNSLRNQIKPELKLYSIAVHNAPQSGVASKAVSQEYVNSIVELLREMQACADLDPSPQVVSYLAECLTDTLIGDNAFNIMHLSKECITLLLLGEQERTNKPNDSTLVLFTADSSQQQQQRQFAGLAHLTSFGADAGLSGGETKILQLRAMIETATQNVFRGGEPLNLSEIARGLRDIIEPEMDDALQQVVAHARTILDDIEVDEEMLNSFQHACATALEKSTPDKDMLAAGLARARTFLALLKSGFILVDKLVTLTGKSVRTALALVGNARKMLEMLAKALEICANVSNVTLADTCAAAETRAKVFNSKFRDHLKKLEEKPIVLKSVNDGKMDASMMHMDLPKFEYTTSSEDMSSQTSQTNEPKALLQATILGVTRSITALDHMHAVLESMLDVVDQAKLLQQEAGHIVSIGDGLVRGLSSLLMKPTIVDVKRIELQQAVSILSNFACKRLYGLVIRLDSSSKLFGNTMLLLQCIAPIEITFQIQPKNQPPGLKLPAGILTVQTTGEMRNEKPVYTSRVYTSGMDASDDTFVYEVFWHTEAAAPWRATIAGADASDVSSTSSGRDISPANWVIGKKDADPLKNHANNAHHILTQSATLHSAFDPAALNADSADDPKSWNVSCNDFQDTGSAFVCFRKDSSLADMQAEMTEQMKNIFESSLKTSWRLRCPR